MIFTKGTAIYTGGGFYSVIGETDDGHYFHGTTDWCEILDADPREENEDGDLVAFYNDWLEQHTVDSDIEEVWEAFRDFCERLDNGEPDITEGYEEYSNYLPGEVSEYIDFSDYNH